MRTTRLFRELLSRPGVVRSLGAHDVFTARLIEAAGLETVFLGGFGTAASLLGLPDVGLLTLTEMADAVGRMAARVSIPVVADGDTGHGDLLPEGCRCPRYDEPLRWSILFQWPLIGHPHPQRFGKCTGFKNLAGFNGL